MLAAIELIAIADGAKAAEGARQGRLCLAPHETLRIQPVADQIGDVDQLEGVPLGVLHQLGQPGHRPIGVLDFADHPRRIQTGQPGKVHGGLGVAGAFQYAPLLGPQGKDVARAPQVGGAALGVDGHLDRARPVVGRNPRAHAVFRAGIHTHGERGLVAVGVAIHHQGQIQRVESFALHRQADQAPRFGGHEVDLFRGGELGRADQIPFVLPVFVIHHHDRFAIADRGQRVGDGIKGNLGALARGRLMTQRITQKGQGNANQARGPKSNHPL